MANAKACREVFDTPSLGRATVTAPNLAGGSDMKCPRCEGENREGARFCRECGALFAAVCSSCGAKVEAGSKFCDNCGTPLAATPPGLPHPDHRRGGAGELGSGLCGRL